MWVLLIRIINDRIDFPAAHSKTPTLQFWLDFIVDEFKYACFILCSCAYFYCYHYYDLDHLRTEYFSVTGTREGWEFISKDFLPILVPAKVGLESEQAQAVKE